MRKVVSKEEMALLNAAGEMFNETGFVPGVDGEQVPAERLVPDRRNTSWRRLTTRKQPTTRRYGIRLDLRWCFFGWRKNGSKDATGSRIAGVPTLSNT